MTVPHVDFDQLLVGIAIIVSPGSDQRAVQLGEWL
jgi:hypothetical protein